MNTASLFSLWQRDKANIALTCDLIASFDQQTDQTLITSFSEALPNDVKQSLVVIVKLIELDIRLGHFKKALEQCQSLLPLFNQHTALCHLATVCYFMMRDFDKVVSFAADNELQPETEIFVARALYMLGELDLAIARIENCQLKTAESVGVLAMLYCDSGDLAQAQTAASQALQADASQFEACLAQAICALQHQQVEEAKPYLSICLKQQPKNGRVLSLWGQVQLSEYQIEQAISSFEEALKTMAEHIGTWHLLGWCYILQHKYDAAEKAFNQSLHIDRSFDETHGALACIKAHQGDLSAATELAGKALRLNRRCYSARYAQSLTLKAQGDETGAKQLIDNLLNEESPTVSRSFISLIQARS